MSLRRTPGSAHRLHTLSKQLPLALLPFLSLGCGSNASSTSAQTAKVAPTQHILFVGDSFTHGRYLPVRTYNNTPNTGGIGSTEASPLVVDENFNATDPARAESQPGEYGPWGGIPGIFSELAWEANLPYDVHIEAISETTLTDNYAAANGVIDQSLWDDVVLQETTFEPIPHALSQNSNSNPSQFCSAVQTIEQGVHKSSPSASVYLYETGAPADTAYEDTIATETAAAGANAQGTPAISDTVYLNSLSTLTTAYHDAYVAAATQDGKIAGIAPTGDAWALAWSQGIANPDPYAGAASGISLTFNYQPKSEPTTIDNPTDAGFHHPSIYGAYLNGLVLFQKITGIDVRTFGGNEKAAGALGIPSAVAIQLQQVAYQAVTQQNTQLINPNSNLCSLTN